LIPAESFTNLYQYDAVSNEQRHTRHSWGANYPMSGPREIGRSKAITACPKSNNFGTSDFEYRHFQLEIFQSLGAVYRSVSSPLDSTCVPLASNTFVVRQINIRLHTLEGASSILTMRDLPSLAKLPLAFRGGSSYLGFLSGGDFWLLLSSFSSSLMGSEELS
jgi:hypothetical protein